ncbi:Crp/Fnr family transcriptional regulator [Sulfurimonas diazotrophicus]|uniref:Crp/Fnr family transcriptional regulator n=1 Tax=Sulfurimonas diazotrophicus TaxID=3131939 RepID=A0ABZ3HEV6_9BACT
MIENECLASLKHVMDAYAPISERSWEAFETHITFQTYQKGETLLHFGDTATRLYFICKGLLRTYFLDEEGHMYNKNLFLEHDFAGSKASMLLGSPSEFCIETLEETSVIEIAYRDYRRLIDKYDDVKAFYIAYLEQKWVIEKERVEIALVLEDARSRYLAFLKKHPGIEKRVSQHHIAAHLGITPTQLSRIRKNLK